MDQKLLDCDLCKKLLTPPIRFVKNDGNICNSCFQARNLQSSEHYENSKLDAVLRCVKFSCRFKSSGCDAEITYDEVKSHEVSCNYQVVSCCFNTKHLKCLWSGKIEDLMQHFSQEHHEYIIKSESEIFTLYYDLGAIKNRFIKILKSRNKALILCTEVSDNKFLHTLASISLTNINDSYKIVAKYCAKSGVEFNFSIKLIPYVELHNCDNSTEIAFDLLKNYSFNRLVVKIKTHRSNISVDLLSQHFECPVCKELMRPPIILCKIGHSFCNNCKPKLNNCPTCREAISNSRNYTLENISSDLLYPCRYNCGTNYLISEIKNHENACNNKSFACPICKFSSNFDEFRDHCETEHVVRIILGDYYEANFDLNCGENWIIRESFYFFFNRRDCSVHVLVMSLIKGQYVWIVRDCNNNVSRDDLTLFEIGVIDNKQMKKFVRVERCLAFDVNTEKCCNGRISLKCDADGWETARDLLYYCRIGKKF